MFNFFYLYVALHFTDQLCMSEDGMHVFPIINIVPLFSLTIDSCSSDRDFIANRRVGRLSYVEGKLKHC